MRFCMRQQGLRAGLLAASLLVFAAGCSKKSEPPKSNTTQAPVPPGSAPQGSEPYAQRVPGTESAIPQPEPRAPERPRVQSLTIPAGTAVTASLQTPVSSTGSQVGQRVVLRTTSPIRRNGMVLVPAGAKVIGRVTHVQKAGRVKGGAAITIRYNELVTPDGRQYAIAAAPFRAVTKGSGKQSAAMIGGGAAAGGVLGGVLGGKKSILPGAAIGGILGTTAAVATKGKQIALGSGTRMTVRFTEPVPITVAMR